MSEVTVGRGLCVWTEEGGGSRRGEGGKVVRQWNLFAFELLWGVGFTLIIATGIYFPSRKAQ